MVFMHFPVKIRGLFGTALTKLLIDAGCTIVDPTSVVKNRVSPVVGNEDWIDEGPPTVQIEDRFDKEGVVVTAKSPDVDLSKFPLGHERFPSLVVFRPSILQDAIYYAEVIKSDYRKSLVALEGSPSEAAPKRGAAQGRVVAVLNGTLPKGTRVLVQVEQPGYLDRMARVSSNVTLSNESVVLILGSNRVLVSRKIQVPEERKRLKQLGKRAELPYGIIFRTAATRLDEEELVESIDSLKEEMIAVDEERARRSSLGLVRQGKDTRDVVFPWDFKVKLDETRATMFPTVAGHHGIKSGTREFLSEGYARSIDLVEALIAQLPEHRATFEEQLHAQVLSRLHRPGDLLKIEHQKLDGRKFQLTPGTIQKIWTEGNATHVRLFRRFSAGGTIDGLNLSKEHGDYAVNHYVVGRWYSEATYFNHRGELKGKYFNVSTPVELKLGNVHYVDLEVDVVERAGAREVLDEDRLDAAWERGVISTELREKALEVAKALLETGRA